MPQKSVQFFMLILDVLLQSRISKVSLNEFLKSELRENEKGTGNEPPLHRIKDKNFRLTHFTFLRYGLGSFPVSPPPLLNYKKRCSKIVHTAIFMLEML